MAASFNPFDEEGNWNWSMKFEMREEDLSDEFKEKINMGKQYANSKDEDWNTWYQGRSKEEIKAYKEWKAAYVKVNIMTTPPGENWFRAEWDKSELNVWAGTDGTKWFNVCGRDYLEFLLFRKWKAEFEGLRKLRGSARYWSFEMHMKEWDANYRTEWLSAFSFGGAWEDLMKEAERRKQERKTYQDPFTAGGFSSGYYRTRFEEYFKDYWESSGRQSGKKITQAAAQQFIQQNLDKFLPRYGDYYRQKRRIEENEVRSNYGQLKLVSVPTVAGRFMRKCMQSGATEQEAAILTEKVWPPNSELNERLDNFILQLMSPLHHVPEYTDI